MSWSIKFAGLPDLVFFPLALLAAGSMVMAALSPGFDRPPTGPIGGGGSDYSLITVSGMGLSRIQSGGERVKLERLGEGEEATLLISAYFDALSDQPERGPHFKIASDLEARFSGHTLEVTITARSAEVSGARAMLVNYSTGIEGDSGWIQFDLTQDYTDYRFTYDVPRLPQGYAGFDYLALKPDVPDRVRAIEIKQIKLRPVAPWQ